MQVSVATAADAAQDLAMMVRWWPDPPGDHVAASVWPPVLALVAVVALVAAAATIPEAEGGGRGGVSGG
eukprot:364557-Chlamydomonas_euryale.AAC.15